MKIDKLKENKYSTDSMDFDVIISWWIILSNATWSKQQKFKMTAFVSIACRLKQWMADKETITIEQDTVWMCC